MCFLHLQFCTIVLPKIIYHHLQVNKCKVWSGIVGSFNIRHHQSCQGVDTVRSICVFADKMGSSSVSPLIMKGGKGRDVGVHDFRYIATRRPKKHKNFDNDE
ncbi:hypothetical protein Hanom_Chr14g01265661 [Helianthus anomalus]